MTLYDHNNIIIIILASAFSVPMNVAPPTMRLVSRIMCLVCLALGASRLVIAHATAGQVNNGARVGGSVAEGGCVGRHARL